jgi:hypothetical protein
MFQGANHAKNWSITQILILRQLVMIWTKLEGRIIFNLLKRDSGHFGLQFLYNQIATNRNDLGKNYKMKIILTLMYPEADPAMESSFP